MADPTVVKRIAWAFHWEYERMAKRNGWETQERSQVAWDELPEENRETMLATVRFLIDQEFIVPGPRFGGADDDPAIHLSEGCTFVCCPTDPTPDAVCSIRPVTAGQGFRAYAHFDGRAHWCGHNHRNSQTAASCARTMARDMGFRLAWEGGGHDGAT